MDGDFTEAISLLQHATGAPAASRGAVPTTGPRIVLPSIFDVTGLATGAVSAATSAIAELQAVRFGGPAPPVSVDSREACAAFAAERLFRPEGWTLPPLREALTGDYLAADGWIRLHTNYAHHRAVVERVLGVRTREEAERAVSACSAEELERLIVADGGAAAAMHDRAGWLETPAGRAAASAPPLTIDERPASGEARWLGRGPGLGFAGAFMPLAGVRVLDLTRVIAGPVCTGVLAAYGADVLRIDPPGFAEVPSLLPITTRGKRSAFLDLASPAGRKSFEVLLGEADVLVCGLSPDALSGLGYDDAALDALNPDLLVARLDAYGWDGPWNGRRGFDSLVQMSCGIAAAGAAAAGAAAGGTASAGASSAGADLGCPVPLPVQALDHASGWLLAATIVGALVRRLSESTVSRVRASLVGTAELLYALPGLATAVPATTTEREAAPLLEPISTAWGPALQAPVPGRIAGLRAGGGGAPQRGSHRVVVRDPGPLGRHTAAWESGERAHRPGRE